MKKIDTNKTKEELNGTIKELKARLLKFKFELNEKSLQDVSQIKKVKKDIARIMTELNRQDSK